MEYASRTITVRQRRLPHWTTDEGTYFVTFRLTDAMSPELAHRIAQRRRPHALADRFLDRGQGRCWLMDPRVAAVVEEAIRAMDGSEVFLHGWTLMPNHAHVAMRLAEGVELWSVLKQWKGSSGRAANLILNRTGSFWQGESYDSLLHDQHDLDRVLRYIANNPVRARLSNWPWTTILRTRFSFGSRNVRA